VDRLRSVRQLKPVLVGIVAVAQMEIAEHLDRPHLGSTRHQILACLGDIVGVKDDLVRALEIGTDLDAFACGMDRDVAAACRQIGLTPVYADIVAASQILDLKSALAMLSDKTLAVVGTHLYGNVVDVPTLRTAMDKAGYAGVPIVEDCAQSHGARLGDRLTGTMGDIATFSFYPTKNLGAFGDGGAIVTNDAKLAGTVRALQQYGWRAKYDIALSGARNSRMDEMQAAILSALLPHLDKHNAERNAIMARLTAVTGRKVRFIERSAGSVVHLAVAQSDDREAFRAFLTENGIASEVHYPILDSDQHGWRDLPQRVGPDGLAASRASVERIVTLPCFPGMSEVEIDRVCGALADWEAR